MKTEKTTRKPTTRKRKAGGTEKIAREPRIVANVKEDGAVACPRCGETDALALKHSRTNGNRVYACFSEVCRSSGKRLGQCRYFVVRAPRPN